MTISVEVQLPRPLLNIFYPNPFCIFELGNLALALTKFSLTYMPLRAVKGQVVANFIVDHSIDANALNYVELGP